MASARHNSTDIGADGGMSSNEQPQHVANGHLGVAASTQNVRQGPPLPLDQNPLAATHVNQQHHITSAPISILGGTQYTPTVLSSKPATSHPQTIESLEKEMKRQTLQQPSHIFTATSISQSQDYSAEKLVQKYRQDPALVFELALLYYRTNKDSLNFDYETKIDLSALYKQATVGTYDPTKHETPGFFDFVGKDRVAAWKSLGKLDEDTARSTFSDLLREKAADFTPWFEERIATKVEREIRDYLEKQRLQQERIEHERQERERLEREQLERERMEREQLLQQEQAKQNISEVPTLHEEAQQPQQSSVSSPASPPRKSGKDLPIPLDASGRVPADKLHILADENYVGSFKEIMKGNPDSEATVSNGEVLTVRVPKPFDGDTLIVWQFCTEDYDISFGVDYETKDEDGIIRCDSILPIIRSNCNLQVITGSHVAQAAGTWLLRFDNSFSYFRSKTVYYRILCYNL